MIKNELMNKKIKRGQVSVWVIVGIILVASVILFFLIERRAFVIKPGEAEATFDVESYIRSCSSKYVNDVVDVMLPHGGFVAPNNTAVFDGVEIEYICKNIGFYEPCIQQHPLLIREMEMEIKNYIFNDLIDCFEKMESDFEDNRAEVILDNDIELNIDLEEDKVVLNINRKIKITKNDEEREAEFFVVEIPNPIYNLGRIAAEIADQESRYCYFEFVGYNVLYPRYQIKKYSLSNPTDIYKIKDLRSGKEMSIATRSCAIPAGM